MRRRSALSKRLVTSGMPHLPGGRLPVRTTSVRGRHYDRSEHFRSLWVPRTGSRGLISAFAAGRPRGHSPSPRSIIPRCGLPTRLSAARPRAELPDPARPLRRSQRRRDPGAPSRGRSAAPTQPTPHPDVDRPRAPQRAQPTAPYLVARAAARLTPNPAALARPPRRPPLDLPQTTTRPPTHPAAPGPGSAVG